MNVGWVRDPNASNIFNHILGIAAGLEKAAMEKTKALANKRRRRFLQGLGSGFAGIVTGTTAAPALAQPTAAQFPSLRVIDFHNHFIGSASTPIVGTGAPSARPHTSMQSIAISQALRRSDRLKQQASLLVW